MASSVRCKGGLFLTYPRFAPVEETINLEEIKTELLGQLSSYVRAGKCEGWDRGVFAKELHKDTVSTTDGAAVPGMQHLHVYVHCKLKDCTQFRVKYTDLDLRGKHGNYQEVVCDAKVKKYCEKDGDFIWWGVDPIARDELRKRHRSVALASLLTGDANLDDVVMEFPNLLPQYAQLSKGLNAYRASKRLRKDGGPPVFLYVMGPSGAGKTSLALSLSERDNIFLVPVTANQSVWYDGYQGESVVVFDNVSIQNAPPYDLTCRLVDRSPLTVPTKGGFTTMWPTLVVVTSVYSPSQVWPMWDAQLARRLTTMWVAKPLVSTIPILHESRFRPVLTIMDYRWEVEDISVLTPGLTAGTLALMSTLRRDPTAKVVDDSSVRLPRSAIVFEDRVAADSATTCLVTSLPCQSQPPTMMHEGGRLFNRSSTAASFVDLDAVDGQLWGGEC